MFYISLIKRPWGAFLFRVYMRLVHGISFSVLKNTCLDELSEFRFKVYCQEGFINEMDYPNKAFADKYDATSASMVARYKGNIIGVLRVTHYSALSLPTFDYFNLELPEEVRVKETIELGRFMVDKEYRSSAHMVSIGLFLQSKEYVQSNKEIKWMVAFMPDNVRELVSHMCPFEVLDQKPIQESHLQARELLPGYWEGRKILPLISEARLN